MLNAKIDPIVVSSGTPLLKQIITNCLTWAMKNKKEEATAFVEEFKDLPVMNEMFYTVHESYYFFGDLLEFMETIAPEGYEFAVNPDALDQYVYVPIGYYADRIGSEVVEVVESQNTEKTEA